MYLEVEFPDVDDVAVDLRDDAAFTAIDPEFAVVVTNPVLSAEWARVRDPRPEPTTALVDGSARARRDARIAQRMDHVGVAEEMAA